jgi:signal transduction histidine kinase
VLSILVEDAIRYAPAGARVTVSTQQAEAEGRTWATVAVSDTGEPIPEADLPHVFERLFREEEPRSERVAGTGLRLMIVKGIVELHGGRVTAESPSASLGAGPSASLGAGPSASLGAGPSTSLGAGPSTSLGAGPSAPLRAGDEGTGSTFTIWLPLAAQQ